jgi:phosphatidylglycerophosphatase A
VKADPKTATGLPSEPVCGRDTRTTAAEDGGATTPGAAPCHRSAGVPPAVAGASRPPLWATLVATFFGAGRLKPGPGTWGSLATVIVWALASSQISVASRTSATIVAAAAVTLIGIPAATLVARASGLKDPQFVVIDEVAGQLVTLIAVPLAWKTFLAGLILFRVFDIWKPFPIRRLERLPEGTGIVVDDLGAGLYALAVMHLLLHFGLLTK